MEDLPRDENEGVPVDENGRLVEIDTLAEKGLLKKDDVPGFDLYDQHRDLTNVSESGGLDDDATGPKSRIVSAATLHSKAVGTEGLSITEVPADEEGNEIITDDAGEDAAAKWLRENDPDRKK